MVHRGAGFDMTEIPTPAIIGARFRRRPPAVPPPRLPRLMQAGWSDDIALPMEEHFYLDTGIFHSLASSFKVVGLRLVELVVGHEENATISAEVRTQSSSTTLGSMASMLLPTVAKVARCTDHGRW